MVFVLRFYPGPILGLEKCLLMLRSKDSRPLASCVMSTFKKISLAVVFSLGDGFDGGYFSFDT